MTFAPRALEMMAARGIGARQLIAAMGPSIGICCFRVGEDMTLDQAAFVEPLSIGVYAVSMAGTSASRSSGTCGTRVMAVPASMRCVTSDSKNASANIAA